MDINVLDTKTLALLIDNLFLFMTAIIVITMQAGFAMNEIGRTNYQNNLNVLYKNLTTLCVGMVAFFVCGYGFMYPEAANGWFGFGGVGVGVLPPVPQPETLNPHISWFHQAALACLATTIVYGSIAGRIKHNTYLFFTAVFAGLIYPIIGSWYAGGGWLNEFGFYDRSGSVMLFAVAGFASLAATLVTGPRTGKVTGDQINKSQNTPPKNWIYTTIGVMLLWICWYGMTAGQLFSITSPDNLSYLGWTVINVTLAAATGGLAAMGLSWATEKKPNFTLKLNGILGGLVAISACCDTAAPGSAMTIGAVAGILVYCGNYLLTKLQVDETTTTWPIFGLCGVWGGMAAAFFGGHGFLPQLVGSVFIPFCSFILAYGAFKILQKFNQLRVSQEEENHGQPDQEPTSEQKRHLRVS